MYKPSKELDDAISVLEETEDFVGFAESSLVVYKMVYSNQDLEYARKKVEDIKIVLSAMNKEFKDSIDKNKVEMKKLRAESLSDIKKEISDEYLYAETVGLEARTKKRESEAKWVDRHRTMKYDPIKVEETRYLYCPICGEKYQEQKVNILNGSPACFKSQCFHKLVRKEDLPKYNRKYRRNWLKKKGMKKDA